MLKNPLLSGVSIVALGMTTGAQAAPVAQTIWSWTGFYVGANIGAASARSSISDDPVANRFPPDLNFKTFPANGTAAIGGIQFGYNWQMNHLVLGVEGDFSYSGQNRSLAGIPTASNGSGSFDSRLSGLGTIRGRVGGAFDRVLVYATGGVAYADIRDQFTDPSYQSTPTSETTRTGWTWGGGVEYAISGPWIVRAEYLHLALPDRSVLDPVSGYAFNFRDKVDIGRAAISYKF